VVSCPQSLAEVDYVSKISGLCRNFDSTSAEFHARLTCSHRNTLIFNAAQVGRLHEIWHRKCS
jgi:hypothetical protein